MDLLITGASGGIARGLADEARRRGWRLALACRDATVLGPGDTPAASMDVSSEAGANHALAFACDTFGRVPDAVANCAGSTLIAPLARTSEAQ